MNPTDPSALPVALPEAIDPAQFVLATYLAQYPSKIDLHRLAPAMAIEQSTGTWVPVPGETAEMRARHVAKVVGIYEAPDYEWKAPEAAERTYLVQIAFPVENIGPQIPMLLTAVIGNISMAGKLKLVDLRLPSSYLEGFQGPRFGIEGVRRILGISRRPLLNNMIKPCTGYSPEVGVELFRAAATGGCDIVKDDELLAEASFNRVAERVRLYMRAEKEVFEATGEHTLYTVNVSDEIPRVFENAHHAVELGCNAIMVNYLAVGLPVLRALAEDASINVPILAHMDLAGALYASADHGISSHLVLGKLPRLAGADIVVFPAPYGKAPFLPEKFKTVARNLSFPMGKINPSFPMPSGGITPAVVPQVVRDLGPDVVIGSGGGIHAHPGGPTAGARAFRQAIDASLHGQCLEDAAAEHEELRQALSAWKDAFGGLSL
jgi:2,3-diketo-5-methylthiopentyl-1-phosphate enolase